METKPNPAHLTGKEGEEFDMDLSAAWTQNYRHKHPGELISHFFGKDILQKILDQEDCVGLRIYHAHDKPLSGFKRSMVSVGNFFSKVIGNVEGEKHVIIVGTTKEGKDIIPTHSKEGKAHKHQSLARTELKEATPVAPEKKYGIVAQVATPCPGSANCP
ncbi:hypothetical protein JN11_03676 [Mucilaginibacter frigoritolerans]|jgi:hypothetical protein|uniref:Uncharacterized protein n=1 Tax=Mucilaginibacter frigoritolerans TaxID=652788 RepID=A0A562TUI8_9SPHI|nr:hypothetical protein [Mucilaginibacter frigoritolerans]TWI97215.1 hypothetical protein JN11_03676 [Mucilaginibacter frigoritolerans]